MNFQNDWSFKNIKEDFKPIFDVIENEENIFFSELPGVNKSDLKIEILKTFKISGTKKNLKNKKNFVF